MKLKDQPGYHFVPLTQPGEYDVLVPFGENFEFYNVALNVGSPIDGTFLAELVAQQDLFIWRMEPDDPQERVAYATLCRFALDEQAYVFCPEGWDNTAVAAGLEAIGQAVFKNQPNCQDLWTCLPLPEPQDAEETLLIMGYTYTPASLDKERRRTFGLSRDVFTAYHEG